MRIYLVMSIAACFLILAGCIAENSTNEQLQESISHDSHTLTIQIPEQTEWIDHGTIFEKGKKGDWDYFITGGFAGTAVKKGETFYLYYQGARDYSEKYGTVTYRAIGVATSRDGIHFTKYHDNPVISWFPNNGIEEGAVSGGATLNEDEEVVMYYGANSEQTEWYVNADGRLAVSSNGLDFSDYGIVLHHKNENVWGSGDELFPVVAFHDNGNWYMYYIPNGTQQSGKLGATWGPDRRNLANSRPVLSGGQHIAVWGWGGYAKVGPATYALFLNEGREFRIEVRTVHTGSPDQVSTPVRTYKFDNVAQGLVFLDSEQDSWFMFYLSKGLDTYGVKVAPLRTNGITQENY